MNNVTISFGELSSAITAFNTNNAAVGITAQADFTTTMAHINTVISAYVGVDSTGAAMTDPAEITSERIAVLQDLFPTADDTITVVADFLATITETPNGSGNVNEVTGDAESFLTQAELDKLGGKNIQVQTKNNGVQPFQAVPNGKLPLPATKSMSACIENVRFTSRVGNAKDGGKTGHLVAEGLLSNGSAFTQDFYEGYLNTILGRRVFGRGAKTWADGDGKALTTLPAVGDRVDVYMTSTGTQPIEAIYVQVSGTAPVAKKNAFITDDPAYVAAAKAADADLPFEYTMPGASSATLCVAIVQKSTVAFANGRINKKLSGKAADLFKQEMDKSFEARADIAGKLGADQAIMQNEDVLIAGAESRARIQTAGNDTITAARAATIAAYKAAGLDDTMIVALIGKDMEIVAAQNSDAAKA